MRSSRHRDPPIYVHAYTHVYAAVHESPTPVHAVASVQGSKEWGRMVVGGVIASAQIEYISYVFITTAPGPRPSLSAPPPATPPAGVASTTSGTARGGVERTVSDGEG